MPRSKTINTQRLYFTERLTRAMGDIMEYLLTVVEAPMGYGKTTAVREAVGRAGITPHWLHVFTSDTKGFWNGFAALVRELDSGCGESLVQLGSPSDAVSMNEAVKLISRVKLSTPAVIVIDDYHHLDSAELNTFFELMSECEPSGLHIVLTARYTKFKRLEELKLKKRLHHIDSDTFALKPQEIADYFKACGIPLSGEQAMHLYGMTDGWISALYLFLLEYVSQRSFTNFKSIYRLLENAVYATLPEETKNLLLSVCIFDGFTLKQAESICGESDPERILTELTDSNLFVTYDNRSRRYYIHSIFTDFLREQFEQKDAAAKTVVYGRAAGCYRQARDFSKARKYCFLAGDFDGLLTALEEDDVNDYSSYDKDLLKSYMAACPEEVKARHPYAPLIYAMHLFVHKELALFHNVCEEVSHNMNADTGMAPDLRNRLLGELELLLSFAEFNDLKKMSEHHKKAWELLNQPTSIYNTGTNWTFGSPSVLSLYYRESGMLQEHIQDIKEGLPYYYRLTNGHGSGAEYAMEAESLFNQGDFENAEISVQKAMLKAQSGQDDNIVYSTLYLQILIAFMKGDLSGVMKRINEMHEAMNKRNEYHFIHMVEICEGSIYAYLDQTDKIPERLLEVDLSNPLRLRFPAFSFFTVMYGRVLLIRGEYLKLIGSAEHFISISSVFSNLLGYIYTYIYLAAAYRKIFREDEALSSLKKALEIAMPDRQYMLFVENCDFIEPLLKKIAAEGNFREDIAEILTLYQIFKSSKERMIQDYFAKEKPSLTERELEIARLAAEGLSNMEIGVQLYISENTVKSALKSVYLKLLVNDRRSLKKALTTNEK